MAAALLRRGGVTLFQATLGTSRSPGGHSLARVGGFRAGAAAPQPTPVPVRSPAATTTPTKPTAAPSLRRWYGNNPEQTHLKSREENGILAKAGKVLPGLALAGCVAQLGGVGAEAIGDALMAAQHVPHTAAPSPVSPVPVAILLGLATSNLLMPTAALPKIQPGLRFCSKTVLQVGIVCVGAKLSAVEVLKLGTVGVPVVLTSITAGLASVLWLNARLGLPARLGSLTAAGTSICGVTAITALAPAIQANQQEVAYAVANVVAFGLFGMLFYPMLAHHCLESSEQVGLFLGTAIHDTSQVMGAGLTYAQVYEDEVALKVAAVTKLMRNVCLAAVIPGLTYMHTASRSATKTPIMTLFPPFIFGFLGMAGLRSLGDATQGFGQMSEQEWNTLMSGIGGTVSAQLLATAMAAVGLSTSFSVFRGVGMKPFAVGMAGAAVVGLTGFTSALLFGQGVKYE